MGSSYVESPILRLKGYGMLDMFSEFGIYWKYHNVIYIWNLVETLWIPLNIGPLTRMIHGHKSGLYNWILCSLFSNLCSLSVGYIFLILLQYNMRLLLSVSRYIYNADFAMRVTLIRYIKTIGYGFRGLLLNAWELWCMFCGCCGESYVNKTY